MRCAAVATITVFCAMPVQAENNNEAALRQYFEGRTVVVRIDMPASQKGVDIRPDSPQPFNPAEHSSRLGYFGVSLRPGDEVPVTKIKVKDDNIEFQLGGGGWGTWGDTAGGTYIPPVTKSNREKDLEREIKRETDSDRRRRLQRELDDLRRDREREEARNRVVQEIADREKREREKDLALQKGSRFNIRFENKVPLSAQSPEAVMRALAEFVEFPWTEPRRPRRDADRREERPAREERARDRDRDEEPGQLRKGLTRAEVERILGKPVTVDEKLEGKLKVTTLVFAQGEDRIDAVLVDGVLVRYTISSK